MNNELLLLSNNDIPFQTARLIIHTPTLKEIALIGERNFNIGCQFLNFSKELLSDEDKSLLLDKTDFEIFMSVVNNRDKLEYKTAAMMVLTLMFPEYEMKFLEDKISFKKDNIEEGFINAENFDDFKDIISSIFCLNKVESGNDVYNPADAQARRIAEKFKKRKETLNKMRNGDNENQKVSIFMRYVSILAVGLQKNINELMNYTVYQIIDEFTRYQKKKDFDMYIQAKMAGAQDIEEVDNWMNDLHSN